MRLQLLPALVLGLAMASIVPASVETARAAETRDLTTLFDTVKNSVVIIRTKQKELAPWGGGQRVSIAGQGSGVLISPEGEVMTAAHVVQAADQVVVEFHNGELIEAKVVSSVPMADVALLQLEKRPTRAYVAPLGDSDRAQVGAGVFVVGAPFGISYTLTVGHISARRSPNSMANGLEAAELFQTDAAINQGNSGGPMFNMNGEVIGIVSHILTQSGGFEGLGFVVTSATARRLLMEMPSFWSGVEGYIIKDDMTKIFNLPQPMGVLVQKVAEGSPAEALGLRPGVVPARIGGEEMLLGGDIILDAMGLTLAGPESATQIMEAVRRLRSGDELNLTVLREGKLVELATKIP